MESIIKLLKEKQDTKYADFQSKLIPNIEKEHVIGVRTPALREIAKKLYGTEDAEAFMRELPHYYFEENQLHAFLISLEKDYGTCLKQVDTFLPYVNNWATCDQMNPKAFKKNHDRLISDAKRWIASNEDYTIRFGIKVLMDHFLDEDFSEEFPRIVVSVESSEYYVNMMRAWYFATALAKQPDGVIAYFEQTSLDDWTRRKAIQKAIESFRVPDEMKEYLRKIR